MSRSEDAGEGQDRRAPVAADRPGGKPSGAGAEGLPTGEHRAGGQAGAPADEQRRRDVREDRQDVDGRRLNRPVMVFHPETRSQPPATRSAR